MTKLETSQRDYIQNLLATNDNAVVRAIVVVYQGQTSEEQASEQTIEDNGCGFNGRDAEFGSSLAKSILKYGNLTHRQMPHARRIVKKYWKQLLIAAQRKGNQIPLTVNVG